MQREPCAICSALVPRPVHPSSWHAAIASAWLLYLLAESSRVAASQESHGRKRNKLAGDGPGGGDGTGGLGGVDGESTSHVTRIFGDATAAAMSAALPPVPK